MSFEPLLLPILVLWSAMLYVTHRGLARNEFRRRWHSGWHYFATNSVSYWVSTAVNFMFLGVCTFMIYAIAPPRSSSVEDWISPASRC